MPCVALETSPEQPAPVRQIATLLTSWIDRLGAVWVEGQLAQVTAAEQRLTGVLNCLSRVLAVDQRGQLPCEAPLRGALVRSITCRLLELRQLAGIEESEPPQVVHDVGIGGVDEVLVPGVRRSNLRVEPQVRASRRLPELSAL